MEQNKAAVDALPAAPDLIIPSGKITLYTVIEGPGKLQTGEDEFLDVTFPADTEYFLSIGKVFRARWRPGINPAGIWSFLAEVGSELAWIEADIEGWTINYSLKIPDDARTLAASRIQ
jgi:hypothetical protein